MKAAKKNPNQIQGSEPFKHYIRTRAANATKETEDKLT